jgi:hypothetical protein
MANHTSYKLYLFIFIVHRLSFSNDQWQKLELIVIVIARNHDFPVTNRPHSSLNALFHRSATHRRGIRGDGWDTSISPCEVIVTIFSSERSSDNQCILSFSQHLSPFQVWLLCYCTLEETKRNGRTILTKVPLHLNLA